MALSVKVILKKDKINSKGEAPLYLRIIKNRQPKYISLGLSIPEKQWDEENKRVKKGMQNSQRVNNFISNKLAEAENQALELEVKSKNISSVRIKENIMGEKNPSFFEYTISYLNQAKTQVAPSTLDKAKAIISKMKEYTQQRDLLFEDISVRWLKDYDYYLRTEKNNANNTVYANLKVIRRIINEAIRDEVDYISLLEFAREERFDMLNIYLEHIRKQFPVHLFIVLDVITDCVFNFNDTKDSMKLIDMMNQSINRYDVTFLCLIHENPGNTDKARGHLGTEILNKASTVIQIGFEKDAENHNTDLIKVAYLKCRSSRKHEPFHVQYSDTEKGLIIADPFTTQATLDKKNQKALLTEITELLFHLLKDPMPRKELLEVLTEQLDCSKRTIISRLKQIIENQVPVIGEDETHFELCTRVDSKEIIYELKPLKSMAFG